MSSLNIERFTYVPPSGSPEHARYVIVGEQPGAKEIRKGQPFIGPAGDELTTDLTNAKITRTECYFTNVIKDLDHPIAYYIRFPSNKNGYVKVSDPGQRYIDELIEEVSKCKAKVVIAAGNVALFALTGNRGISKYRGSVLTSSLLPGKVIIPIIHPATVIPPKNQYLNKFLIIFDLKKARRIADNGYTPIERTIIIRPSFEQIMEYLYACRSSSLLGYDIECLNQEVSCISFAKQPNSAISIPFLDEHGDYLNIDQEADIWLEIAKLLQDSSIKKVGQNLTFDAHFLFKKYGIISRNIHDTMIAQGILSPEYPKGLHFICSIYTDIPYYKDDGKEWTAKGDWPLYWRYNALDSIVCVEAFPKMKLDLELQGNWATYERQRAVIHPLAYMMERGIAVDVEAMKTAYAEAQIEIEETKLALYEAVGYELNPNSSKQVSNHFYNRKGLKPYKKKGRITANVDALKRISQRGHKEAKLILDLRTKTKLASTYLNIDKIDEDRRIRCSYNPVGTRFSRLSSSENIFGRGMNMQNWPHSLLTYLHPDDGYLYYSYDLSQAENRIVAYVGGITPMIEAFESGKDVHCLTASLIFGKSPEAISREKGSTKIGDGKYSERDVGKKANHSFNYDVKYRTVALKLEISEAEAKWLMDRYHTVYPGVKQGYHVYVKAQLSRNRTLTNLMGRKTVFRDRWGHALFTDAYACIPQGTVGDIVNERGLNYIYYDETGIYDLVEVLIQVHDSIGFQIPLSASWDAHARALLGLKRSLETPLETQGRKFIIPTDLSIGLNLNKDDLKASTEISSANIPDDIDKFAELLEKTYKTITEAI